MARQSTLTLVIEAKNKAKRVLSGAKRSVRGFADDVRGNFDRVRQAGRVAMRGLKIAAVGLASAFGAVTAGVVAFTKSMVDVASEVERAQIQFKALFEDAAEGERAFRKLREAAAQLPFTFQKVMQAGTSLAVISDDAEELQTRLFQAAEISARFGLSLEETASNMIRFFEGGAASADLFRERGVLAAIGVRSGMQTSVEESTQLWNQFFERIEREGTSATKELATSFEGIVSMLQDLWFEFRLRVSRAGVFDALKESLDEFRESFRDFLDSGGAERFGRIFSKAMTTAIDALNTFSDAMFALIRAMSVDAGEAWRNVGIIIGSKLGEGLLRGLEAVLRESNLLAKIPGPVGDLFDTINLAALGAEQAANIARQSAEEAAEAIRILADVELPSPPEPEEVGGAGGGGRRGGGGGGGGQRRVPLGDQRPGAPGAALPFGMSPAGEAGVPMVTQEMARETVTNADIIRAAFGRLSESSGADLLSIVTSLKDVGFTAEEVAAGLNMPVEKVQELFSRTEEVVRTANQAVQSALIDTFTALGENLGRIFAGLADGFTSFGEALLGILGNLMQTIGRAMIAFGVAGEAIKKFITNPVLAIAAGTALIALGAALASQATSAVSSAGQRLAGGGGGGVAGAGASFQQDQAGEARQPPATVIIRGGLLNMNDPRQRREFSEALENLTSRRVIIEGA